MRAGFLKWKKSGLVIRFSNVQAFIDTEGSPVIEIALDQWADGTYMVIDAIQIR